jgi:signal transduction histidine kinase
MSVRVRLALLLALVVTATLLVAFVLTRRAVLAPFAESVLREHLDQSVYVATELERGAEPEALGRRLGLDIILRPHPPRFGRRGMRNMDCDEREHRGRALVLCRGPRAPVAVRLQDGMGWAIIRRDVDIEAPAERAGLVLAVLAAVIVALSSLVAVRITRPLKATVEAMQHMAEGELSHRLPVSGGRELEEVARAFNAMADRIDQMLRAEKEMMAGISHELRTPLARLRLELELLRDAEVPHRRLDAMEQDVEEVDHLIDELLELSRLSLGAREVERVPVDLGAIAREAVSRQALPRHHVEITGTAQLILGDRPRLVRVVANLLQNAGKYAPPDSRVTVRLEGARLTVEDEGPGVPQDDLPRLFEPFYRGQRGRQSSATGYGLGLMYAKQVVELAGGTITAENRAEGGLRICLELQPAPAR